MSALARKLLPRVILPRETLKSSSAVIDYDDIPFAIPPKFHQLLNPKRPEQPEQPTPRYLKAHKPVPNSSEPFESVYYKRILSRINDALIDAVQSDPLPPFFLDSCCIIRAQFTPNRKTLMVLWRPSLEFDHSLMDKLEQMAVALQPTLHRLLVLRLGHGGIKDVNVPKLKMIRDHNSSSKDLESVLDDIEREIKQTESS